MRLIFLKEGRRYTDDGLIDSVLFQLDASRVATEYEWLNRQFVHELRDAMNKERHAAVRGEKTHVFHYLGLFDFTDSSGHNLTFFFLPKFLDLKEVDERDEETGEVRDDRSWEATQDNLESWEECLDGIKPVVRNSILLAIDRYHKEDSELGEETEFAERERESVLELAIRVLRDYLENGAYIVHRAELEQSGQGEVDWDATIDRCDPLFVDDDPVYTDYFSSRAESDENYYITRLQRSLVTFWGRKLEALGLSSVLGVNVPPVSEEDLDLLGEPDYQVAQIDRELKIQFVTKARETLKLMKALILRRTETRNTFFENHSFGITGVEHLWEAACAHVLGSELKESIKDFGLVWEDDEGIQFDKFMPRIIWEGPEGRREEFDNDKGSQRSKKAGWRLDFIRTYPPHDVDSKARAKKLVILDAKYYCAVWRKKTQGWTISGQPGTPDITKQMYYQMVFKDLQVQNQGLGMVNAFLFPEDDLNWSMEGARDGQNRPTVWKSETVSWNRTVCAFNDVRLFTVRIPGLRLLERYARCELANDWFEAIVNFAPNPLGMESVSMDA